MNAFPLAPFLDALATDGIFVSFADYDRISTVLGTGDKWTRARLRGVLLALLAHNQEQAQRLERRFDAFFPEDKGEEFSDEVVSQFLVHLRDLAHKIDAPETASEPGQIPIPDPIPEPQKSLWSRLSRRPLFWCIAVSILALLVIGRIYYHRAKPAGIETQQASGSVDQPVQQEEKKATGSGSGSGRTTEPRPDNPRGKQPVSGRILLNAIDPVRVLPSRHGWQDLVATFGLMALLCLLWLGVTALVSRALKDPAPRYNPNSPRLFSFKSLGEASRPQLDGSTLDQLADSINYFLSIRPSKRLDLNGTVKETGNNAGMAALRFYRQRQVRRVCLFEDSRSEALVWNKITSELIEGLSKRGVDVLYGRFSGSPTRFLLQDGHTYWVEDLDNERKDSLFLFFSDGKHLRDRRDMFALEILAKLPLVAWFDFREPRFWNESAQSITTFGIPIYQANARGLQRAFDRFLMERANEEDDSSNISQWRGFPPFTDGHVAVYTEHLLGDALVWAQTCAMIQPLSLNMAHTLRHKFQPHLPPERIQRLFRLPGTTWQASCIRFSRHVLAALRGGFTTRLSLDQQDAILDFIQEQIRLQEPPKGEESLRHLAWDWTLRRVQLEKEPDEVLPIISGLSQTSGNGNQE